MIVGFKLETEGLVEKAYAKLLKDGLDLIVANGVGAIGSERDDVYIINRDKKIIKFSGSKQRVAARVLDCVIETLAVKGRREVSRLPSAL